VVLILLSKLTRKDFQVIITFGHSHGHREDFIQVGAPGYFSKIFPGGAKSGEFVFSHSKLRKQPFFAEIFKIQRWRQPHCSPFRCLWSQRIYYITIAVCSYEYGS